MYMNSTYCDEKPRKRPEKYPCNLYRLIFGGPVKKVSWEMEQGLEEALALLGEREEYAIEAFVKEGVQEDTAEKYDITVTRRDLAAALDRLRTPELLELITADWPKRTPKYWEGWQ